jgi:hypothetical protein
MQDAEARTEDQDAGAQTAAESAKSAIQAERRAQRAAAAAEASYLLSVRAR